MQHNWASATTTTTGTGSLTLASASGWPTPAAVVGTGRQFRYAILDDATGAPLASGIGTMADATTLTRGAIETTFSAGTYTQGGSVLSLAAGTKRVIVTALAEDLMPALPGVQGSFGSRIVAPDGLSLSGNTKTLSANVAYLSCLRWSCARPITALSCNVTTLAGTGTDRIQLGIYACKSDGTLGDLIARTGDIAPNTTGYKTASLAGGNIVLPSGWYWWAIASNVAPAVRAYDGGANRTGVLATPMGHASSDVSLRYGFFAPSITGGWSALPSTITLSGPVSVSADFAPQVGAVVS